MKNNKHISEIIKNFQDNDDLYTAHNLSKEVMKKIIDDQDCLHKIIEHNLLQPAFFNKKRHYPTMSLNVYKNELIDIVINIYPELPSGSTKDVSFQSIHHHGNLMLSTIALSGPGYSSIVFEKKFFVSDKDKSYKMEAQENYQNVLGKYTFCDTYQPHVVFYPKRISSTFALWSKNKKSRFGTIKAFIPNKLKKNLSVFLSKFGLKEKMQINIPENFDFYVENNLIFSMKDRIHYPIGSNDNFIQNIFYYFESVNYNNFEFLEILIKKQFINDVAKKWIRKYLDREHMFPKFEDIHLNIDKRVNISKESIENVLKN